MPLHSRNLTNLLLLFVSLAAWWFTSSAIQPELHYFLQQTAFLTDRLFFQGFTRYPGGIADYLSEFVAQFFHFNALGSLLIILVASIQGIIALNLVKRITGKVKLSFSIFALILLMSVWVQCDYHYPFYAGVRLLLSSCSVWIFTVLILRFPRIRQSLGFLLAAILFYLAGGAALFVFTAAVILIQIRFQEKKTDWFVLPVLAIFSGVLPYIAYKYFFLVDLSLVYSITNSKSPIILFYDADYKLYILYSLLPIIILFSVLHLKFKKYTEHDFVRTLETKKESSPTTKPGKKLSGKAEKKPVVKVEKRSKKTDNPEFVWMAGQFILLLALAIFCINTAFNKEKRNRILVSFYGAERDWANVIKTAENLNDYDLFTNFEYNKALANTGKLAENFLNYPQLAGSHGLFLDGKVTSDVPLICSDQFYDLGFIYESQHWSYEAQTIFPNSPRLMKRLVQINLINRKYDLAEKFLNRLAENMLCHNWVTEYQKFIQDTSLVAKDPEFSWKRKCEPIGNFTSISFAEKLKKLIEANPANKMAFEYLLCSNLLDGDLGAFEAALRKDKKFPKHPLPRSYDEALVLYAYVARKVPGPDDIPFTKEKQSQFVSFIKSLKPFGNDWKSARQSLKKEFGTTYWYYTKCLSPKVTNAQIKQQKSDD
jgi:hypothetical protein